MKSKLFISLFIMLFLVGTVSAAMEWDNVKTYDESKREVTVTNFLGLGSEIAKIRLVSRDNVYVPIRYQRVAEFDVSSNEDYINVFNNLEFINVKTAQPIDREFDYKIEVVLGQEEIQNYTRVCNRGIDANGTTRDICNQQLFNTYMEDVTELRDFDETKGLIAGNHRISIWTNVQPGDYVDWVPTLYGERIPEWATWQDVGSIGLKSYHTLNESALPMIDSAPQGIHDANIEDNTPAFGLAGGSNASYMGLEAAVPDGINLMTYNNSDAEIGNNWSVSVWWNSSDGSQHSFGPNPIGDRFLMKWNGVNDRFDLEINGLTISDCSVTGMSLNTWHNFIATSNGTGTFLYADGVRCSSNADGKQDFPFVTPFWLGCTSAGATCAGGGADAVTGGLDEFVIFNRSLSNAEILAINQSITFAPTTVPSTALQGNVTLIAPANNTLTASTTLNFTANSTVLNGNLTNATLNIFFVNHTLFTSIVNNTSGHNLTNTTHFTVSGLLDGIYVWNVDTDFSNDTATITNRSLTNRTFTISTTAPILTIHQPINNVFVFDNNLTVILNFTAVSGSAVDTCFYHTNENVTNITIPCNLKTVVNFTSLANKTKTIFVFANDTLDSLASNQTIFNLNTITATVDKQIITEGDTALFTLTIDLTPGDVGSVTNLTYNNTGFIPNFVFSNSTVFIAERTLSIPLGTGNLTGRNVTWNWTAGIVGALNITTPNQQQTVFSIGLANCTVQPTVLLNYTMVDEDTQVVIVPNPPILNTTIEVDITITSLLTGVVVANLSTSFTNINPAEVCISIGNLSLMNHRLDAQTRYESTDRVSEFHNIQNLTLNNETGSQNITLFDLLITRSQEFLITFKNKDFLPENNVLVKLTRKYIPEGVFKTVEIGKTDSSGESLLHMVLGDVIYTILLVKNGEILATLDNVLARCDNQATGECIININAFGSTSAPGDFKSVNGLTFDESFDAPTKTTTVIFSSDAGVKNVTLIGIRFDRFGNTTVCSDSLITSAGTLTCTVPDSFGNITIMTSLFTDGVLTSESLHSLEQDKSEIFGVTGVILTFIVVVTMSMMFITSVTGVMIGAVVGLIMTGFLIFTTGPIFGAGSVLIWLLISAGIIIWKIVKSENAS